MSADEAKTLAPYLPTDGVIEPADPGRSRVTLGSWSRSGLAAAFAAFVVDFTVEEPPPLRDAMLALANRLHGASTL